jgi:hypothetical protein
MFFNYVQQGTEAAGEHRVHHPVFAQRGKSGFSAISDIREPICPGIAITSTGVRVFVWGRMRD